MRTAFSHLGITKHTPWCPVPSLSPPVSHTCPLTSPPPSHLSLFVCTVWTIVLVINITVHPHPQVGKYNILCALGNLYNSILNLNEIMIIMIKKNTCWKKQLKRDNIGRTGKSKICVSLLFLFLFIFAGFSGRSYKTVTAEQGFCCVFTKRQDSN